MFLWKLPKRMFYLYHVTFEGRFVNSGFRRSRFVPSKSLSAARVCDKKGAKHVVIRRLLYELFGVNRTLKANKAKFSTNLSVYLAAKNGIWFMLSWKCFFTLCEVDFSGMNGKVRLAGGTRSVSSCPHLQSLVYTLFNSLFFLQFLCLVGTEIFSSVKKGRVKRGKSDLTFWIEETLWRPLVSTA